MNANPTDRSGPPNIIMIMSDQHNPHVMSCAGDPYVQTPNLDALAASGVLFSQAYCSNPLCVPSRMGFMTGRYPSEIECWTNQCELSSEIPTFAHGLGASGYETVLCSRMHFVGIDQFHGFEKRLFGEPIPDRLNVWKRNDGVPDPRHPFVNGMSDYSVKMSGYGKQPYQYYDLKVTELACDYIKSRPAEGRPYCLVVGYVLPHDPYIADKDLFDHYMAVLPEVGTPSESELAQLHPAMSKWRERHGVHLISPLENRRARSAYYGLVTEMDRNIGLVLDAVSSSGDADNTVVIYCSDHGDMAGEKGLWWKSNFYEGSVGIPLIVSFPQKIQRNQTVTQPISLIDLAPTLLDIGKAEPLPQISGLSLLPLLTGESSCHLHSEIFADCYGMLGNLPSCMLRWDSWKMVYFHETDSCQLFNLTEDPGECHDLRDNHTCQPIIQAGREKISRYWSAQDIMSKMQRKEQQMRYVRKCGHPLIPHAFPAPIEVPDEYSYFDRTQLPDHKPV